MAIKTENQLVLKIEKVIREHKIFKNALQEIGKKNSAFDAASIAKGALKGAKGMK